MNAELEKSPQVSAPERFACILRQFTEGQPSKRLSDLSAGAGLPISTTHRLLKGLVDNKVLVRDEDGRYQVGPLMRAIADQLDQADLAS